MIYVACSADDNYVPHCGAMLHSLFTHNMHEKIHVYFFSERLSKQNEAKLYALCNEYNVGLNVHYVPAFMLSGLPTDKFHPSCWYRILLPELLPEIDRVLYLDADMIIKDCVSDLWQKPLKDYLFAAVVNPLYPFMRKRIFKVLGTNDIRYYLNSGVLLMNLRGMRETGFGQKLREYAEKAPENIWPEQDALSAVSRDQWLPLSPRWNVQSTIFHLSKTELPYTEAEIEEAICKPAIVHFIGPQKPWHYLCRHPWRSAYHDHRNETPWGEARLEGRTFANILLRPFPFTWQMTIKRIVNTQYRRLLGLARLPAFRR